MNVKTKHPDPTFSVCEHVCARQCKLLPVRYRSAGGRSMETSVTSGDKLCLGVAGWLVTESSISSSAAKNDDNSGRGLHGAGPGPRAG
jgi:hypothetical protein